MQLISDHAESTTWITANQRLALHLRQQYNQTQQLAGHTIWPSMDCLPLKDWLARTYHALAGSQLLLNEQQELILWEQIIADSLQTDYPELILLSARSLAQFAKQAWHLLQGWQVPLAKLGYNDSAEVSAFYHWATLFERRCQEKNCLDSSASVTQIITALATQQPVLLPAKLILTGFIDLPPQLQQLFDLLANKCLVQHSKHEQVVAPMVQRVGLENAATEWLAMAQWAQRTQLQHPGQTIGCVVPELSNSRHQVARIFNEVFADQSKFSLSSGLPFDRFPLVQTAIDILKLGSAVVDMRLCSRLLNSPFLGGAEQEFTARAALDVSLREAQEAQMHWQALHYFAAKQSSCPIWLAQCQQYQLYTDQVSGYQPAQVWSEHFAGQLHAMGWPGERSLTSAEYQQVMRWQQLLTEFSGLDLSLAKPLSRAQALYHLVNLAQSTLFQPQTKPASVQVLGMLEAVGLVFDHLWVSGMTQENWPNAAAPNPFIPISLQRACRMPHASAERELTYSRTLTDVFCQSAAWVMFSYALQQEDRAQAPSALIKAVPEVAATAVYSSSVPAVLTADGLDYITDEYGPQFQEPEVLRGGASLFKQQAACPFRAFARLRLSATSLPTIAVNMTLQERGTYLHAMLEKVWQTLRDQHTLCQYTEPALAQLIETIADQVLNAAVKKRALTLRPYFLKLEKQRFVGQITAWLQLEKLRPPFKVVAVEAKQQVQFAGLTLKMRIDREDELLGGERVLIDYKTGACGPADWFGERPDDPQLPLYGLTRDYPVHGLAFAQLLADKLQFVGISDQAYAIDGIQPIDQQKLSEARTWQAFYAQQATTLTRLAQEFQAGHANRDPKQQEKTCRICDLQPICRIYEKQ